MLAKDQAEQDEVEEAQPKAKRRKSSMQNQTRAVAPSVAAAGAQGAAAGVAGAGAAAGDGAGETVISGAGMRHLVLRQRYAYALRRQLVLCRLRVYSLLVASH